MRFAAIALLGTVGCARVFGLTDVGPPGDITVTGTSNVERLQPPVAPDGQPRITFEPDKPPFGVTLADGQTVALEVDGAAHTFSFDVPDGATYVVAISPDIDFVGRGPELDLVRIIAARAGGEPATVPPSLKLTISTLDDPRMARTLAETTGVRAQMVLTDQTAQTGTTQMATVTYANDVGGSGLDLLDANAGDLLWFVRETLHQPMNASQLPFYVATEAGPTAITLVNGQNTPVTVAAVDLASAEQTCVQFVAPIADAIAAVSAAAPAGWSAGGSTGRWVLGSAPAPASGPFGLLELGHVDPLAGPANDAGQLCYVDPFPDESGVMEVVAEASAFPIAAISGALPSAVAVSFGAVAYAPAAANATLAFAAPLFPLPGDVTLAGQPLAGAVGGIAVMADRTQPIPVDLAPVVGGPAAQPDDYEVQLEELALGGDSLTILSERHRWFTSISHIDIAPALLEPGHHYTLNVLARWGTPAARTGDFRPIGYPAGISQTWTADFTVP